MTYRPTDRPTDRLNFAYFSLNIFALYSGSGFSRRIFVCVTVTEVVVAATNFENAMWWSERTPIRYLLFSFYLFTFASFCVVIRRWFYGRRICMSQSTRIDVEYDIYLVINCQMMFVIVIDPFNSADSYEALSRENSKKTNLKFRLRGCHFCCLRMRTCVW